MFKKLYKYIIILLFYVKYYILLLSIIIYFCHLFLFFTNIIYNFFDCHLLSIYIIYIIIMLFCLISS